MQSDNPEAQARPVAERSQRAKTFLVADFRRANGSGHQIRVRDLSATGLRGQCTDVSGIAVGESVWIRFPNLSPITATIVRVDGSEVGATFAHAVDIEQISAARATPPLPDQSPRSEVVSEWIDRNKRQQQMNEQRHAFATRRPI